MLVPRRGALKTASCAADKNPPLVRLIRTSRFFILQRNTSSVPLAAAFRRKPLGSISIFLHCFVLEIEQGQPSEDIHGQGHTQQ